MNIGHTNYFNSIIVVFLPTNIHFDAKLPPRSFVSLRALVVYEKPIENPMVVPYNDLVFQISSRYS